MIVRARAVVTMEGAPIANGAVAVAGNKISDVGGWAEVRARNSGEVIDLGERVLLPGFINAHCHLDYTDLRGAIPPHASFTEWIRAINARKASWKESDYLRSIEHGIAEACAFGTTTLANFAAFPNLLATMGRPPVRIWWFGEMIDVRDAVSAQEVYEALAAVRKRDWLGGVGLAPHTPYSASAKLYAEAAAIAAREDLPVATHLAESREETEMFRDGRGALFEFMQSLGRSMGDCGSRSPFAVLSDTGLLDERWIVAHLNELTEEDLRLLSRAPRFHVVHCPRSHAYFGHSKFELTKLRNLGFNISLGTDSLASNADLSLLAELRAVSRVEPCLSPRELLEMVTINPAIALRQAQSLGQIRAGFNADLVAAPHRDSTENALTELLHFEGKLPWMMVDGQVIPQSL